MAACPTHEHRTEEDHASANPADTYERFMVPALFAPSAERLLEVARPMPGDRVLDVGCGTGIVARRVAPRVGIRGSVAGLDPNPKMLAVARAMAATDSVAVDWHEGVAEALPFAVGSFDLVLSQYALMFFSDRHTALVEMRRVLAPDGRLALNVWQGIDRHPFYGALDAAIARHLGTSAVAEIFALGDPDALRQMLLAAGFGDVSVEPFSLTARFPNPEAFLAGEIDVDTASIPAMQNLVSAARRDLTMAIASDMAQPLRAVTEGDYVQLEFHAHIAQASVTIGRDARATRWHGLSSPGGTEDRTRS